MVVYGNILSQRVVRWVLNRDNEETSRHKQIIERHAHVRQGSERSVRVWSERYQPW